MPDTSPPKSLTDEPDKEIEELLRSCAGSGTAGLMASSQLWQVNVYLGFLQ